MFLIYFEKNKNEHSCAFQVFSRLYWTVTKKVKEITLQGYQHQDVPFEQIVDHLNVTRELNRNPVFQVMFTLEQGVVKYEQPLALKNIHTSNVFLDISSLASSTPATFSITSIAKFDLSLSSYEYNESIDICFDYATDLFDEKTIKRFARHFEKLTKEIIKDPSISIDTLSLLTETEKHQLLIEWNDTKVEYPEAQNKTITQLFEEQVERTPDNIAVVTDPEHTQEFTQELIHKLTYKQLNEKANQLAHYLRTLGVGPDTLVAIAVERSLEMIIGPLGILKAGGAYVPLDPDYPEERLKFMLEDTKASILITQLHLQEKMNGVLAAGRMVIVIDQVDQLGNHNSLSQQSIENPVSFTLPEHLAYLIYTSGSTGQPKGQGCSK